MSRYVLKVNFELSSDKKITDLNSEKINLKTKVTCLLTKFRQKYSEILKNLWQI